MKLDRNRLRTALEPGLRPDGKVVGYERLRPAGLQRIRDRLVWARVKSN